MSKTQGGRDDGNAEKGTRTLSSCLLLRARDVPRVLGFCRPKRFRGIQPLSADSCGNDPTTDGQSAGRGVKVLNLG